MEAFRISMTLLGAVAILAALAGAFNVAGVAEGPVMNSRTIRVLLFCFGGFLPYWIIRPLRLPERLR